MDGWMCGWLLVVVQDGPEEEAALHVACRYGHQRVVEALMGRRDLSLAARDGHGHTPLYLAVAGRSDR